MKYMGSKNRIAKHILPIILKDRKPGQCYVEPFVGGANIIDKVDGLRIGADSNEYAIDALKLIACRMDIIPKDSSEFSEVDYINRCENKPGIKPFAAFAYSFGSKFWGGFRRDKIGIRDYIAEAYRNAKKQSPLINDVGFINSSYCNLDMPDNSVVYCDPPYAGTTKYKDDFDHVAFFEWCRNKVKEGHQVFISEYNAPEDFICVWQKEIQSGLNTNSTKKGIERLFVHETQLKT